MKVSFSLRQITDWLMLAGVLGFASSVSAQSTFHDNFTRGAGPVGGQWSHISVEGQVWGDWQIAGTQTEAVSAAAGQSGMVHTGLALFEEPFMAQADFWTTTARWYGVIFHADPQNIASHWIFRIQPGTSAVQLLRFVDGAVQTPLSVNTTVSPALTPTGNYRLQVRGTANGNVEVRLFDGNSGAELWNATRTLTAGIPEGGGYAGVYAGGSGVRAVNFSLVVGETETGPGLTHSFQDDFDRADSMNFGPHWEPTSEWVLRDATAQRAPSNLGMLHYTGAELSHPFQVETQVRGPDFGWRGIVFHRDGENSFVFRLSVANGGRWQILREPGPVVLSTGTFGFEADVYYRLAVESAGEGEPYRFTIHEVDEEGTVGDQVMVRTIAFANFADSQGGTAGIFTNGPVQSNWFSLRTGPEAGADYLAWLDEHFEDVLADEAALTADSDGDGIPNALEYALDLDPKTPNRRGLPNAISGTEGLTLEFTRRIGGDARYSVQASNDLQEWTEIASLAPRADEWDGDATVRESEEDGRIEVEVDDLAEGATSTRRFMRLVVTVDGVEVPAEPVYYEELVFEERIVLDESSWAWNTAPWDQEKILSVNGFQYAIYWNSNSVLTIARRDLSDDSVQTVTFPGESLWIDNPHYSTALGVSESDGRLHLSYGQWVSSLNYIRSVPDFLTNPPSTIERSHFGVRESMVGTQENTVTYPRFFNGQDGTLFFLYRSGGSGNGASYLNRYDSTTGSWARVGMLFSNTGNFTSSECGSSNSRNAYENDIIVDSNGRIHITWVFREGSGTYTNHDLHYAYSDDDGNTWRNNDGLLIADLAANDPIRIDDPGIVVAELSCGMGIINTGAMVVDSFGQPHVVLVQSTFFSNIGSVNLHHRHYWRNPDGSWSAQWIDDVDVIRGSRPRGALAVDPLDNLHYFFFEGDVLKYYTAKADDGWTGWSGRNLARGGSGEGFRYDRRLWAETGRIEFPIVRGDPEIFELQILKWIEPELP